MQKCSIYFYLTLLASGFMVHFWIWNITMKCHIIKCSNYKKDNMRLYQANCKQPPVLSFFTKSPITRLVLKRHSSDTFVLSFKQLWDKNRAFFSNEQCCHPDGAWSQADISSSRSGGLTLLLPGSPEWAFGWHISATPKKVFNQHASE